MVNTVLIVWTYKKINRDTVEHKSDNIFPLTVGSECTIYIWMLGHFLFALFLFLSLSYSVAQFLVLIVHLFFFLTSLFDDVSLHLRQNEFIGFGDVIRCDSCYKFTTNKYHRLLDAELVVLYQTSIVLFIYQIHIFQ